MRPILISSPAPPYPSDRSRRRRHVGLGTSGSRVARAPPRTDGGLPAAARAQPLQLSSLPRRVRGCAGRASAPRGRGILFPCILLHCGERKRLWRRDWSGGEWYGGGARQEDASCGACLAADSRKYRINRKDMCSIRSWPSSCWGKPLGYKIDDTKLKRAGLDYWPYVVVKIHDSWDDFRDYFLKQEGEKRLLAFTKRGTHVHSDFSYKPGDWLVFGSETKGLPQAALEDCCREGPGGGTIRIPMVETYVRCLNLSVSVGIAVYEAARQLNYEQLQYQPELPEEAQGVFPTEDIYA